MVKIIKVVEKGGREVRPRRQRAKSFTQSPVLTQVCRIAPLYLTT